MVPVVFHDTIGWLNEARGSRGVVIAGGHGFEDLCSRRFLAMLAREIAAAGLPVLQFDYPGWGDALGDYETPGLLERWERSVAGAIDCLKRNAGVDDVIVVGFRLGALLAYSAAARRDDIAALALLAPPATGRHYLREQTIAARMVDSALRLPPDEKPFDGVSVGGCRLSNETSNALKAFDPFKNEINRKPPISILLLARGEPPVNEALAEQLRGMNCDVTVAQFDGYNSLMRDTTAQEIPADVIKRCVDWVSSNAGGVGPFPSAVAAASPQVLNGRDFIEEPVIIGAGTPRMAGVFCRPRDAGGAIKASGQAFIIPNSGANPRAGWARGAVELARTLAAHGIASLRVDLPGLGQSEEAVEERQYLYDIRTRHDVVRAIDWMCSQGYDSVALAGICSGAHHAFHAARMDPRVTRLAIVNILCFDWTLSHNIERMALQLLHGSRHAVPSGQAITEKEQIPSRRVSLQKAVKAFVKVWGRPAVEILKTAFARLTPAFVFGRGRVEHWMADLTGRGTKVLVVCSDQDLSHNEIARHFGPEGKRLGNMNGVTRHVIAYADHSLTQVHARDALARYLIDWET